MKRIRCPKCDESILFDETKYEAGRVLVFECPDCHKQFKLRMPKPKADAPAAQTDEPQPVGHVVVLENAFQLRQEISLYEGENVLGRMVKGTQANAAFKTVDPSIDTTHCIISAKILPNGTARFEIRDAPSNTGTFVQNELLAPRDHVLISDGNIINIGAATLILRNEAGDEEE